MTVPEIVMAVGIVLIVLAVGYLVWKSKQSPEAPNAISVIRKDIAWLTSEMSKLRNDTFTVTGKSVPPVVTAASALSPAPVQATSVAGWSLGTSYTSPAALLADVARPDFPPVRIDGKQEAGVTGFDFYTLADGSVSQTKPA